MSRSDCTTPFLSAASAFLNHADSSMAEPLLGEERAHETLTSLTARTHSLYWIFIPGFAILSKMGKYLNMHPTWFICGHKIHKVASPDCFLKCDRVLIKEWKGESGDDLSQLEKTWPLESEGDQVIKLDQQESSGLQWEFTCTKQTQTQSHQSQIRKVKLELLRVKVLEMKPKMGLPQHGHVCFS